MLGNHLIDELADVAFLNPVPPAAALLAASNPMSAIAQVVEAKFITTPISGWQKLAMRVY